MGFCYRKSAEDLDMGERHWAIVCFLRWSTVCNASLVNVPTERAILFNHDKSSLSSLSWIQQSWVETISDKNFKINIKISQVHVSRPLKIEAGISSWYSRTSLWSMHFNVGWLQNKICLHFGIMSYVKRKGVLATINSLREM